jgi:predicted DNA-binding transcriptional regulator YafY
VVEIREVLRAWLQGAGLRTVASRAGVDRKTARRYVEAAQAAGLVRSADVSVIDAELVGAVGPRFGRSARTGTCRRGSRC